MEKLPDLIIGDLKIYPPIIQGGMGVRVSKSKLTSAVSNEGALGVIASVGLVREDITEEEYKEGSSKALQEVIIETKELTNRPFGVNIMYALTNFDELVKTCVDERVAVILSGAGLPLNLPVLTKNSNIKLIPIISSARAGDIILRAWQKRSNRLPDALVVEGPLAGGHIGFSYAEATGIEKVSLEDRLKEVLSLVKGYEDKLGCRIPIIAAGGIFDGKDLARMLQLGASGVQIATRFVCTKECDVAQGYKDAYLRSKKEDITVILSPAGMPARVIKNKFVERIQSGEKMKFKCPYKCLKTCDPYSANYCIAHALVESSKGNLEEGIVMSGMNAYKISEITTVKDLLEEITDEAIKELNIAK